MTNTSVETWTAHLEIEGDDYGTLEIEGDFRHGEWYAPTGWAYFCSCCGRVWGTVRISGQRVYPWTITCAGCAKEGHNLEVGGSVWLQWERSFNEALPRKALEREFELLLEEWDRKHDPVLAIEAQLERAGVPI